MSTDNAHDTNARSGVRDVGIDYQYKVITYIASHLCENKDVTDFSIYSNWDSIPLFDDIILKVWFNGKPKIYLGQIKHKETKVNVMFNKTTHNLNDYFKKLNKILANRQTNEFFKDVDEENVEFWFYTNAFLKGVFDVNDIQLEFKYNDSYKSILNQRASLDSRTSKTAPACYKLIARDDAEHNLPLNKFHMFLNQPNNSKIENKIADILSFSVESAQNIIKFVDHYISTRKLACITKYIFETEVLRIHLSKYISKPTITMEINPEIAENLIDIISDFHVTLAKDEKDIIKCLYSCFSQKIKKLYGNTFDWNDSIDKCGERLSPLFWKAFAKVEKENKATRHWIRSPDTISTLLQEMWKADKLPLLLEIDLEIPCLEKYKHLNKKFIILGDVERRYQKMKSIYPTIFTNFCDIDDFVLSNQLLRNIPVSLQGKTIVPLSDVVDDDVELKQALTTSFILDLMKEKRIYVLKECLTKVEKIAAFVTTSKFVNKYEVKPVDNSKIKNIIMYIEESTNETYDDEIKVHENYKNHSRYYLKEYENKYEYIHGDLDRIKDYCVDQDENPLFIDDGSNKRVPIICPKLPSRGTDYIFRKLRNPIINKEFLEEARKRICFFCGDIESMDPKFKEKIIDSSHDIEIEERLERNEDIFINVNEKSIDELWNRFSSRSVQENIKEDIQLLYLNVIDNEMKLIKAKNCSNLSRYVSYSNNSFPEETFFHEVKSRIALINGEPGVGKSTLLTSLSHICTERDYVLYCNLADHHNDFCNLSIDPFIYIYEKSQKSKSEKYQKFSNLAYGQYRKKGRLTLFVDSLDEILHLYEERSEQFINELVESKIKIVIASRLADDNILAQKFGIEIMHVDDLSVDNVKSYLNSQNLSYALDDGLIKILEKPLYLKFLTILSQERSVNLDEIDKADLCNGIIDLNIERYLEKLGEPFDRESKRYQEQKENILLKYRDLALVLVFKKDKIKSLKIIKSYSWLLEYFTKMDLKLAIVKNINGKNLNFVHHIFAEFLAMEWISKNLHPNSPAEQLYRDVILKKDKRDLSKYFFDNITCKELKLHKAVLKGDLSLTNYLCKENAQDLLKKDKCGRPAVILASTYCSNEENYKILETIVNSMSENNYSFKEFDKYIKWNWIKYLDIFTSKKFFSQACSYGLHKSIERYLKDKGKKRIANKHIQKTILAQSLATTLVLIKQKISLLSDWYDRIVGYAIKMGQAHIIYELENIHHRNEVTLGTKNKKYVKFVDTMQKLTMDPTEKKIKKYKNLKTAKGKFTALILATMVGNVEMVKRLLGIGVDVTAKDKFGNTALHYSVMNEANDITTMLTCAMTKIDINGISGDTPLHIACRLSNLDAINTLSRKDSNCLMKINDNLYTPFLIAVKEGKEDVLQSLIDSGADVNQKDKDGNTGLHIACQERHIAIMKNLSTKYVNLICIKNDLGLTPFDIVWKNEQYELAAYFFKKIIEHPREFRKILYGFSREECLIFFNTLFGMKFLTNDDLKYRLVHNQTPMHIAARCGDSNVLKFLINQDVEMDTRDAFGYTPLQLVKSGRDAELFLHKYMAMNKVPKNYENRSNNIVRIIFSGASAENFQQIHNGDVVDVMLYQLISKSEDISHPRPGLHFAVYVDSNSTVYKTISNIFNSKNNLNTDVLYNTLNIMSVRDMDLKVGVVCTTGKIDGIRDLLITLIQHQVLGFIGYYNGLFEIVEQGLHKHLEIYTDADNQFINKKDLTCIARNGRTLLHTAVMKNRNHMIEFLLNADFPVNVQDDQGDTPLHFVKTSKAATLLLNAYLKNSLDINEKSYTGKTALHKAAADDHYHVIEKLLDSKANIFCRDDAGWTPLHHAVFNNHVTIVKLLLKSGASVNEITDNLETSLHLACRAKSSSTELVTHLLKQGANVKSKDKYGNTPLHLQISNSPKDFNLIICVLLEYEADPTETNYDGESSINIATRKYFTSLKNIMEMELSKSRSRKK